MGSVVAIRYPSVRRHSHEATCSHACATKLRMRQLETAYIEQFGNHTIERGENLWTYPLICPVQLLFKLF